jgi:hypothetical protein
VLVVIAVHGWKAYRMRRPLSDQTIV